MENRVISTIHKTQQETIHIQDMVSGTNTHVSKMNENIMEITYASETVSEETQNVMNSISSLQTTIQQFQV